MELTDLMNSVTIWQTALLRWLTIQLRSLTVILTLLLYWIYLFLLMLVLFLQWFSLHWKIQIILLIQFSLTFHETQNGMLHFISQFMTLLELIGTVFVII